AGGCLALMLTLFTLPLFAVIESLDIGFLNSPGWEEWPWSLIYWRKWPTYLLIALAIFLSLQFLRIVFWNTSKPTKEDSKTGEDDSPAETPTSKSESTDLSGTIYLSIAGLVLMGATSLVLTVVGLLNGRVLLNPGVLCLPLAAGLLASDGRARILSVVYVAISLVVFLAFGILLGIGKLGTLSGVMTGAIAAAHVCMIIFLLMAKLAKSYPAGR
ncbi:MAG: hypothetical protein AAF497_16030, partial [Planctomycetota bacterium]